MLILSRRQNERVNFPALGITIEVIRTGQKKVQLGIDAPPEIRVIRDELDWHDQRPNSHDLNPSSCESVRNELHKAAVAIRLSQNLMQQGRYPIAEQTLDDAISALTRLEHQFPIESPTCPNLIRESRNSYCCPKSATLDQIAADWHHQYFSDCSVAIAN